MIDGGNAALVVQVGHGDGWRTWSGWRQSTRCVNNPFSDAPATFQAKGIRSARILRPAGRPLNGHEKGRDFSHALLGGRDFDHFAPFELDQPGANLCHSLVQEIALVRVKAD
jgi:hypothetical protein